MTLEELRDCKSLEDILAWLATPKVRDTNFGKVSMQRFCNNECLMKALRAAEQRGIDKNAGLRKVADKTAKWLRRLELQAQNQAEANRGRFNSLADAAIADANNYAAVAKALIQAVAEIDARQAPVPTSGAVEVAEQLREWLFVNSGLPVEKCFEFQDKAAAIIQQYGDGVRAKAYDECTGIARAVSGYGDVDSSSCFACADAIESNVDRDLEQLKAVVAMEADIASLSQPPAADGKLREALGRIHGMAHEACVAAKVFDASDRPIIRLAGDIMQEADAAIAQPASGGGHG